MLNVEARTLCRRCQSSHFENSRWDHGRPVAAMISASIAPRQRRHVQRRSRSRRSTCAARTAACSCCWSKCYMLPSSGGACCQIRLVHGSFLFRAVETGAVLSLLRVLALGRAGHISDDGLFDSSLDTHTTRKNARAKATIGRRYTSSTSGPRVRGVSLSGLSGRSHAHAGEREEHIEC